MLYQEKKAWQCTRAASIEGNRDSGRYFRILNCRPYGHQPGLPTPPPLHRQGAPEDPPKALRWKPG